MSELEQHVSWHGLPTVSNEQDVPFLPDTLSETERHLIHQAAESTHLDVEHPTSFPPTQTLFHAEPPHPADQQPLQ